MVHGAPDYHKRIILAEAFGYTDKIPVYEVAPVQGRYYATPPTLTDKDFAPALMDENGRLIVKAILDATSPTINVDVTDKWARQLGQVDLARVLGAALAHTNPVIARLTDGSAFYDVAKTGQLPTALDTGALKVREQNPLTSIQVSNFPADYPDAAVLAKLVAGIPVTNWISEIAVNNFPTAYDVSDRAMRLLGRVYGNQGQQLQQRAIGGLDFPLGISLDYVGSVPQTASDWTAHFRQLDPATAIGTLEDLTGNSAAQQFIAASTPCVAVVIRALAGNTGQIRVGDANVSATRGAELSAGDAIVLAINNVNLGYFYGVSPNKVSITYVT